MLSVILKQDTALNLLLRCVTADLIVLLEKMKLAVVSLRILSMFYMHIIFYLNQGDNNAIICLITLASDNRFVSLG